MTTKHTLAAAPTLGSLSLAGCDVLVILELNTPNILKDCTGSECVILGLLGKGIDSNRGMKRFEGTFGGTLGRGLGGLPVLREFETAAIEYNCV